MGLSVWIQECGLLGFRVWGILGLYGIMENEMKTIMMGYIRIRIYV